MASNKISLEKLEPLFQAKRQLRKERAKLPIEDKIKILVQLQQIAQDTSILRKGRSLPFPPWKTG